MPVIAVAFALILISCQGRDDRLDDALNWNGPYVLDKHIYYLDPEVGTLMVIDPRAKGESYRFVELESANLEENSDSKMEGSFKLMLKFPQNDKIMFVSEKNSAYYVVDDSTGKLLWKIEQPPLEYDHFSFSDDGQWMVGFFNGHSYYTGYDDYYEDEYDGNGDSYYYEQQMQKLIENAEKVITTLDYDFTQNKTIVANTHTVLLMELESGEVFYPTLSKNDTEITSVSFTGKFYMCEQEDGCGVNDAMQTERIVFFGDSRLWIIDPSEGDDAATDVIPLTTEYNVYPDEIKASLNLDDDLDSKTGIDSNEALFVSMVDSNDVVAINMLWDQNKKKITYSINKLGLPFVPYDFMPYRENEQVYLLVTSGSDVAASIQVNSAKVLSIPIPVAASRIYKYESAAGHEVPILYGGNGLVAIDTENLELMGDKNITSAAFGFSAGNIRFSGDEMKLAVALLENSGRMATVNLEELLEDDVDAGIMELTTSFDDYRLDESNSQLYLLSSHWDYEGEGQITAYALNLENLAREQIEIPMGDHYGELHLMKGADDQKDLLMVEDTSQKEGYITVSAIDGSWSKVLGGFFLGDIF